MVTRAELTELYTGLFSRAPDAAGLEYWYNGILTGQTVGITSLTDVAKNWTALQPEGLAIYPKTLTNAQFVEKMYSSVLSRPADAEGVRYWVDQIASGKVNRDSLSVYLISGAKGNVSAQGLIDSALISNKTIVGLAFAEKGLNDKSLAAKVLTSVSTDANSVAATLAIISLIPYATAGQSAAVFASATQLLSSLSNLIGKAPGELADAATFLQTLAGTVTGTTNILTLIDNANVLLTSAADNPAALDNPAKQGVAAVVAATPVTGTPVTFTVQEDINGGLTFGGTATGPVALTLESNLATFTRGAVSTSPAIVLSNKTVIDLPDNAIKLNGQNATTLASLGVKFSANDVITVSDIGENIKKLDFTNFTTARFGGTSVKLDAIDNKVSLDVVGVKALTASGLKFAAGDVVTVQDTGSQLANLTFTQFTTANLGGTTVVLNALDNVAILSVAQADALRASGLKFAAGDTVKVSAKGADLALLGFGAYSTNFLGGSYAVLDATDNQVSLSRDVARALVAANVKFSADDVITLVDTGPALANLTFTQYSVEMLGGAKVMLDAVGKQVTLLPYQVTDASLSGLKYVGDTAIIVAASGNSLNNLTFANYTTDVAGGSSVALNASDNNVTLSSAKATELIASKLKFASDDTLTITIDTAQKAAALGAYTKAALGGSTVTLDATDNTWTLSATALSSASQAGIVLATSDTVIITNTLAQGGQVISAGFQTLNDKLSFISSDLAASNGYSKYVGGGPKLTFGDFAAKLLVGDGVTADEAGATFTFDTVSHVLSYDADGSGTGNPIAVVTLTGVSSLSTVDFIVQ